MQKILVSWSIAYDYIMGFDSNFKDSLKEWSWDTLNASLLINKLKKETWWTGLNVAFNLAMLWEDAILLWAIWEDFEFDQFIKDKINLTYIHKSKELLSSSAYIINDNTWGQIISFYPWAMDEAEEINILDIKEEISYFMVSPNKKEAMLKNIVEANQLWMKIFFDPGQMIWAFTKNELQLWAEKSNYLIVNESEFNSYLKTSEKDEIELLDDYEYIIVTLWVKWSKLISDGGVIHIDAIKVDEVLDPTWAWDAYRAWLLKWLKHWFDLETSAKIWSIVSSYCVAFHWAQNHFVNSWLVIQDMKKYFDMDVEI